MKNALRIESLKLTRSPVGITATLAMVLGMLGLLAGITAGVAAGNPELTAKAGPAAARNWAGLVAGAIQITAGAAVLGFGIVLAWIFAREFAEGTITGLFALPVNRDRIALAKLTVYAIWASGVTTGLVAGVLVLGLLLGYGTLDARVWVSVGRLATLSILSAGIATPIAWVATMTRSLLAAVGRLLGYLVTVVAQRGPDSCRGHRHLDRMGTAPTRPLTNTLALPRGQATLAPYRWRAASLLVPTREPMADHGIPDLRAARTASSRCRSASDRSATAARSKVTALTSNSSSELGS